MKNINDLTGMDYIQMGIEGHKRTQARHQAMREGKPFRTMPERTKTEPVTKMKKFTGSYEDTLKQVNDFYEKMTKYPTFRVINTNTVPMMNGVTIYITYQR